MTESRSGATGDGDINPDIAKTIRTAGLGTNYHDSGQGPAVLLVHGSGPGASAWANWRLSIPALTAGHRVIAPDLAGFGYSDRPVGIDYGLDLWISQLTGLLDALELRSCDVIGNSFGGAIALALAIGHPDRVRRLALMGSMGISFPLTPGLDAVWGYTPSLDNMRRLLDLFMYDRSLVSDELAQLRYQASVQPGVQETFAAMFPAPRQRWIEASASAESAIRALENETLIVHGREDRVIPLSNALTLFDWIPRSQLHVFGRCGHWTQIEHAARFNRLVAGFLSGT